MSKSKSLTIALIVVLIALGVAAWFLFGHTASGLSYPNAEKYSIGDASVSDMVNNLFIDWTAGKVTVEYYDGKEITVSETANRSLSEDDKLRWWLDGDTLRVRYAKPGFRISFDLDKQLTAFAKEIVVLRTHKKMIALLALENAGRLTIYYSIPYFCAMALNIPVTPSMLLNIIALSSFVAMINAFLPMPGSAGGTEATFILMFSTIFGKVDATSIMLLWRLVTFYQTLIIGGIVFLYAKTRPNVPISTEEEHMPRTYAPEAMQEIENQTEGEDKL